LKDEEVCILQKKGKKKKVPDREWLGVCGNSIRASVLHDKNAFYSSETGKSWKLPCWSSWSFSAARMSQRLAPSHLHRTLLLLIHN